jgi:hypothetical protein
MNENIIKILNDQFLGKRITLPVPARDNYGKVIPNKFVEAAGQCTFIGTNTVFEWELHVDIENMPVRVRHINDIKLAPTPNRIRKNTV